jgi:PAS domain S-box-containing protein
MQNRTIIFFSIIILLTVALLSVIWEFFFEFQVLASAGLVEEPKSFGERINYVCTVTTFSAVGMIAPTMFLVHINSCRNRAEEALQISEHRFHRMMDASPNGMFFRDLNGRFLIANNAYQNIYKNPVSVVGKTISDINPPQHAKIYHQHDNEVIASGNVTEHEFERKRNERETRHYSAVRFPIFDSKGNIEGVGGIISNITLRKQAEMALIRAMDDLAKSSQAKSAFLAHMSHELRTPLNAIMGFSELMETHTFGPLGAVQYDEYVANIHSSGQHLLELIDDVLDLSKIEAGQVDVQLEPIDVEELISGSITLVRGEAKAHDMNLYTQVANNLPHLLADRRMVKQMLFNLLSNAIKFTRQDGEIKVVADLADNGGIRISVVDSGIGIAKDDIPIVITPYGQIIPTDGKSTKGTGLGIPLVVEFLKLHEGLLEIDSEVDVGTTMTLAFSPTSTELYACT